MVVVVASIGSGAQGAPKPKGVKGATGTSTVCGQAATVNDPEPAANLTAAGVAPLDLAKWFGDKASSAIAGHVGVMGFDYVSRLALFHQIFPESSEDRILDQLKDISLQLGAIQARLDRIGDQLNQAIGEARQAHFDDVLRDICKRVNDAKDLYTQFYVPVIDAGTALGTILESPNPELADVTIGDLPDQVRELYTTSTSPCNTEKTKITCWTPRELVDVRMTAFADEFKRRQGASIAREISDSLRPTGLQTSVMSAYGKVLMANRFLTSDDSDQLLGLYGEFAQSEALAAWMAGEYFTYDDTIQSPDVVFKNYLKNTQDEKAILPPRIPQGMVIDLGVKNAPNTKNRPIWTLASTQDQNFWPTGTEFDQNDLVATTSGAVEAIAALKGTPCAGPACFKTWHLPSRVELENLMSDGCVIDSSKNPPQFVPKTCVSNVKTGTGGDNVAGYLANLIPNDATWQGIFCDRTNAPAGGSAPATCPFPVTQHTFIWSSTPVSQWMTCGHTALNISIYKRRYWLGQAIPMQATNLDKAWTRYPTLPDYADGYDLGNSNNSHARCDATAANRLARPESKGVVLGVDTTGTVEFMAQP